MKNRPLKTTLSLVALCTIISARPASAAIDPVTAAAIAAAVKASADVLLKAFTVDRTAAITITNATSRDLVNAKIYCTYGSFTALPPYILAESAEVAVAQKAAKGLYGTGGVMTYDFKGTNKRLAIYWANPYSGKNTFSMQIVDNTRVCGEALFNSLRNGQAGGNVVTSAGSQLNKPLNGLNLHGVATMGNAREAILNVAVGEKISLSNL